MSDSMTTEQVDQLIGRTVRDSDFRERLLADPATVLADEGYPVDANVVSKIEDAQNHVIGAVSTSFNLVAGVPDDGDATPG